MESFVSSWKRDLQKAFQCSWCPNLEAQKNLWEFKNSTLISEFQYKIKCHPSLYIRHCLLTCLPRTHTERVGERRINYILLKLGTWESWRRSDFFFNNNNNNKGKRIRLAHSPRLGESKKLHNQEWEQETASLLARSTFTLFYSNNSENGYEITH